MYGAGRFIVPQTPRPFTSDPDDGKPKHLVGRTRAYTYQQIEDSFAPADRSPTYMVRQLCDIQSGARSGPTTELMKPTAGQLTLQKMIDVASYIGSKAP